MNSKKPKRNYNYTQKNDDVYAQQLWGGRSVHGTARSASIDPARAWARYWRHQSGCYGVHTSCPNQDAQLHPEIIIPI